MWKEFRAFALRGNVLDMAVGIIIGTAFGKIVSSLVNDILMPPMGLLLGRVDFSDLYVNLSSRTYSNLSAAQQAGAPTINYGVFLNTILDFVIVALAVFLVIRWINRAKQKQEKPVPPATQTCPYCRSTIPAEASRCPNCTSRLEAT